MDRTSAIIEVSTRWEKAWKKALAQNKDPRDMLDDLQSEFIRMKLIAINSRQHEFGAEFFTDGEQK